MYGPFELESLRYKQLQEMGVWLQSQYPVVPLDWWTEIVPLHFLDNVKPLHFPKHSKT